MAELQATLLANDRSNPHGSLKIVSAGHRADFVAKRWAAKRAESALACDAVPERSPKEAPGLGHCRATGSNDEAASRSIGQSGRWGAEPRMIEISLKRTLDFLGKSSRSRSTLEVRTHPAPKRYPLVAS